MIKLPSSDSVNRKLGRGVRATYREVGPTCPSSCEHLQTGACYALYGFVNIHSRKSPYHDGDAQALEEYVTALPKDKKIRHHVSGDFMKPGDIVDEQYVGAMLRAHQRRPDLQGWTYTHAWKQMKSGKMNAEKSLTVNASCDSIADAKEAQAGGWPATTVVPEHYESGIDPSGVRVVVCPHQTHGISCSDCMLCFRKQRKCIVGFQVHGTGKPKFS